MQKSILHRNDLIIVQSPTINNLNKFIFSRQMLKDFQPRLYQETILASAIDKNTLVVLPTGLGKTHIFLMLAIHRLTKFPESKILFLGPTRPLITQYYNLFLKHTKIVHHFSFCLAG